ncbi:MAG: YciI family protein [Chloroflexota bacterium]|nr:YciI family protein [Chloroflexota bacterium]
MSTRYVVLYESAENVHEKAPVHFPAHSDRVDEFHDRGTLLQVGTFADPQAEGSMAVFTTREAAEEFVAGDPFIVNGVVARYEIREWNEVLGG